MEANACGDAKGTVRGFQRHIESVPREEPCRACRDAKNVYNKARRVKSELGHATTDLIPILGSLRRLQALMYNGWPCCNVLQIAGLPPRSIAHLEMRERINKSDADKIKAAYRKLITITPDAKRHGLRQGAITSARKLARARGYVPAGNWEDIDNDKFDNQKHLGKLYKESA